MSQNLKYQKLWKAEVRFTQEDELLKHLVEQYGIQQWVQVTRKLNELLSLSRSSKQCRERWINFLNPHNINN